VDSNENFAQLGFAPKPLLTSHSKMFIDGSKLGGYTTNYKLEFRNVA